MPIARHQLHARSARAAALVAAASAMLSLAGCAQPIEADRDVACIYDEFNSELRALPFPAAVAACSPGRPPDLTGAAYYQQLATDANIRWISHDPEQLTILLTGSRIPHPTNIPAPPELSLN